jgi:anti-sigma factor RsiW
MKLDDYTLAAYLSGELSADRRPSVAAALIRDPDSCEVLHMACEALAEALRFESVRDHLSERATRPPARPGRRDRPGHIRARPTRGLA